mmetsp:Transcript_35469/g.97987  ORF Transcript_35469/g.97987 Transcript_35469/m.97987 type:complete len:300 (+) Transcript_35469:1272-2171(+)
MPHSPALAKACAWLGRHSPKKQEAGSWIGASNAQTRCDARRATWPSQARSPQPPVRVEDCGCSGKALVPALRALAPANSELLGPAHLWKERGAGPAARKAERTSRGIQRNRASAAGARCCCVPTSSGRLPSATCCPRARHGLALPRASSAPPTEASPSSVSAPRTCPMLSLSVRPSWRTQAGPLRSGVVTVSGAYHPSAKSETYQPSLVSRRRGRRMAAPTMRPRLASPQWSSPRKRGNFRRRSAAHLSSADTCGRWRPKGSKPAPASAIWGPLARHFSPRGIQPYRECEVARRRPGTC